MMFAYHHYGHYVVPVTSSEQRLERRHFPGFVDKRAIVAKKRFGGEFSEVIMLRVDNECYSQLYPILPYQNI